jgi:hypothetical protein
VAQTSKAPAPAAKVTVTADGGDQVSPRTPIVVKATDGTLTSVTVTNPQSGNTVSGALSADKLTWTSNEQLRYDASYQVTANAENEEGKPTEQKGTVRTVIPGVLTYPSLTPAPDSSPDYGVGTVGCHRRFQYGTPTFQWKFQWGTEGFSRRTVR